MTTNKVEPKGKPTAHLEAIKATTEAYQVQQRTEQVAEIKKQKAVEELFQY